MNQLSLPFSTPKAVLRAWQQHNRSSKGLKKAEIDLEKAQQSVPLAKTKLATVNQRWKDSLKTMVLTSCRQLEQLMASEGRGWCPLCRKVVEYESFGNAVVYDAQYYPEERAGDHGYYGGGRPARSVTSSYIYRVPHGRSHQIVCPENSHGLSGGSIVSAPDELFAQYGIPPPFDESTLELAKTLFGIFHEDPIVIKNYIVSPQDFIE